MLKQLMIGSVTAACFFTGIAVAEPTRQISLTVGSSQQDLGGVAQTLTGKGYTNVTVAADKRDTSWKIGYQHPLNKRWSANVAYVDLGKANATISTTALPAGKTNSAAATDIAGSLPERGKGVTVSALYHAPLSGKWNANMGLGLYAFQDKRSATVNGTKETVEKDGTNVLTHLGVSYQLNPKVSLEGEWEHYFLDEAVDHVGLGVAFSF